jgi:lysozyme family protein
MTNNFNEAFAYLLKNEGEYANDQADPGGETKFGISKRSYPQLDIKNLTLDQAKQIYYQDYWLRNRCNLIENLPLATKFFDLSVNMGAQQATKALQRALLASGTNILDDGIIGPITIDALKKTNPVILLAALKSEAAGLYRLLAKKDAILSKFLTGWLRRAYA